MIGIGAIAERAFALGLEAGSNKGVRPVHAASAESNSVYSAGECGAHDADGMGLIDLIYLSSHFWSKYASMYCRKSAAQPVSAPNESNE